MNQLDGYDPARCREALTAVMFAGEPLDSMTVPFGGWLAFVIIVSVGPLIVATALPWAVVAASQMPLVEILKALKEVLL